MVAAKKPPQTAIDIETIKYIQEVFNRADKNGGGDLDEREFIDAFLGKLSSADGSDEVLSASNSPHMPAPVVLQCHVVGCVHAQLPTNLTACSPFLQEALRKLFYRIDANADGTVDWVRTVSASSSMRCGLSSDAPRLHAQSH